MQTCHMVRSGPGSISLCLDSEAESEAKRSTAPCAPPSGRSGRVWHSDPLLRANAQQVGGEGTAFLGAGDRMFLLN